MWWRHGALTKIPETNNLVESQQLFPSVKRWSIRWKRIQQDLILQKYCQYCCKWMVWLTNTPYHLAVLNQHPLSLHYQDQLRRQARGTLERSGSELYIHETMVVTTHMSAGKYIILYIIIYNIVKCGHGMSLHFFGGFWPSLHTALGHLWRILHLSESMGIFCGNSQEEVLAAERARHKEDDRNVGVRLSELEYTQTTKLTHIMLAKQ